MATDDTCECCLLSRDLICVHEMTEQRLFFTQFTLPCCSKHQSGKKTKWVLVLDSDPETEKKMLNAERIIQMDQVKHQQQLN